MFKSFLNWLGAWLLATLFVFLVAAAVIVVIMLGRFLLRGRCLNLTTLGIFFLPPALYWRLAHLSGFAGLPRQIGMIRFSYGFIQPVRAAI